MVVRDERAIEERFLAALRAHLQGWKDKVEEDFSQRSFDRELAALRSDPVYPKFALASADYVFIRLMGRMSISIGRRLGELYDKIPRLVAAARFGISEREISPNIGGLLLDICIRLRLLSDVDKDFVRATLRDVAGLRDAGHGVGIEIRYNFNPNDSARLRKDVDMVDNLIGEGLIPVYLVFSSISPRDEAIRRLTNAGWRFFVGEQAIEFSRALFGLNLGSILDRPTVSQEIEREVNQLMADLKNSHAFQQFIHGLYERVRRT